MKIKKTGCLAWIAFSLLWVFGIPFLLDAMGVSARNFNVPLFLTIPIIVGVGMYAFNTFKAHDYVRSCKRDFQEMGYSLDLDRLGAYGKAICADFTHKKILLIEKEKINKIINASDVVEYRWLQKESTSTLTIQINDPHFPLFEMDFLMAGKAAEHVAAQLSAM